MEMMRTDSEVSDFDLPREEEEVVPIKVKSSYHAALRFLFLLGTTLLIFVVGFRIGVREALKECTISPQQVPFDQDPSFAPTMSPTLVV